MLCSELIAKLEALLEEHGDVRVGGEINCVGYAVSEVFYDEREDEICVQ
jgi:hypothetical protein